MAKSTKRLRMVNDDLGEIYDYDPPPLPPLSAAAVTQLGQDVKSHHEVLLGWLANEKSADRKEKLKSTIVGFFDAFKSISEAYTSVIVADSVSCNYSKVLQTACENIKNVNSALEKLTAKYDSNCDTSYANVVSPANNRSSNNSSFTKQASKVTLTRGKPFEINVSERIIIGPSVQATDRFDTSLSVKDAVLKALDPVKLKLREKRVGFHAGLEIKPNVKMDPRLIVHDVPVDISSDEILNCITSQNLPAASIDDFKTVYLFPSSNKKYRSFIFETKPAHKLSLLSLGKINIG